MLHPSYLALGVAAMCAATSVTIAATRPVPAPGQHEAALRYQQGITWSEHAGRLESFLLSDLEPIYRSVLALPPPPSVTQ